MRKRGSALTNWRYWRNLALFGLCALVIVAGGAVGWFTYRGTQTFLHPPRYQRPANETPARYGVPYQEVRLRTVDGLELAGWYTPPENGVVILVAHGYADARYVWWHTLFGRNGYGVVSWDFRAHGESEGQLCTMGYYEALDVEAALDFALSQEGVAHVGAWGGSMGGVAVIEAASRREEIEALVVDSPFSTLEDEIALVVPFGLIRSLIHFFGERETGVRMASVRPVDRIGQISPRPVMIIQGMADQFIPLDSAQRLYDAAGEPRALWTEAGVEHLGMYGARPAEYKRRVIGFFTTAILSQ